MLEEKVYSISELNRKARGILEGAVGSVWVKGEVSNPKRAASGHLYFTIKDEKAEISAVRFKDSLIGAAPPEAGTEILAYGRLTLYEKRGRYQLIVSIIQPAGLGALMLAFEQLKDKLNREGLFAAEHKRPFPPHPGKIGVITSPTGAAIRDIISVLTRRWPALEVYLFPATVQGEAAPAGLIFALSQAERFSQSHGPLDLIVIGRGGGSLEDLAAFNDERLARAIFSSDIPILSAVGHAIDFTIADFVADQRAPTPSAAAELIAPDRRELATTISTIFRQLINRAKLLLEQREQRLARGLKSYGLILPRRRLEALSQELDLRLTELLRSIKDVWGKRRQQHSHLKELIHRSDPYLPLRHGYSLTFRAGSGVPLRAASLLSVGEKIESQLAAGKILSQVKEVKQDEDR